MNIPLKKSDILTDVSQEIWTSARITHYRPVPAPFSIAHSYQSRDRSIWTLAVARCYWLLTLLLIAARHCWSVRPPALPILFRHHPLALNPAFCEHIPSTFPHYFDAYFMNKIYCVSMRKYTKKKRPALHAQMSMQCQPLEKICWAQNAPGLVFATAGAAVSCCHSCCHCHVAIYPAGICVAAHHVTVQVGVYCAGIGAGAHRARVGAAGIHCAGIRSHAGTWQRWRCWCVLCRCPSCWHSHCRESSWRP